MSSRQEQLAVRVLRWTLGLVVLWESYKFGFTGPATRHLERMGVPNWTAPALGGAEMVAAILFVTPKLGRIGGYALLVIFAVAAALHLLHGQFEIGALLVYGAAVFTCLSAEARSASGRAP